MSGYRLANESSPYLRQHATNAVEWFAWGAEAFEKARQENKPIFLSIGYAACHWCHVMEHESFTDASIGELLASHFVSIKVDREERPDVDHIYMTAVQALTGHGGWPMSAFLTPDLQPFYAGTYFPPTDRHGLPSFRKVLEAISKAWGERSVEIRQQAAQITESLADHQHIEAGEETVPAAMIFESASRQLQRIFDPTHGGLGSRPKFPHPLELRLLFRLSQHPGNDELKEMALLSLRKMAQGGIYDQLAGGFHRYSTDERWLVPHFEKMLYDNALLVPAYLDAYQLTADEQYRRTVEETLNWVTLEMTSPDGAFFSTTDADSEGVEGKYFVWSEEEIGKVLGDEAEFFCSIYDVTTHGNWEESNILNRPKSDEQGWKLHRLTSEEYFSRIEAAKQKLLTVRKKRIPPLRDEKILASWNGLMIASFALAGRVLGNSAYVQQAASAANFVLKQMRQADGRLYRTAGMGQPAKLNAYLEDYSFVLDGLIELYQATFDSRWLNEAKTLADLAIDEFGDDPAGAFYFTGKRHEELILRDRQAMDNAVPSGNSMMVLALLRLGTLLCKDDYLRRAEKALAFFSVSMAESPMGYPQMITALEVQSSGMETCVFVGPRQEYDTIVNELQKSYSPNRLLAYSETADSSPLFLNRPAMQNQLTLYRCKGQQCELPIAGIERIRSAMA